MLSLHVVCAIMASTPAEQVARISIPYDSNGHPTAMTFGFWNKAACVRDDWGGAPDNCAILSGLTLKSGLTVIIIGQEETTT